MATTAHQLAKMLLAGPDLPVIGASVGQGSNEGSDEDFLEIEIKSDYTPGPVLAMQFGPGEMTWQPSPPSQPKEPRAPSMNSVCFANSLPCDFSIPFTAPAEWPYRLR